MRSVVHIVGARPQFVKMAVVLDAWTGTTRPIVIHTGQHYDARMSQVFFDDLGIPHPDYNLGVGSGPHGAQTAAMMVAIEGVLATLPKGVVVLYGDTNSTLAGGVVAAKMGWRVVHVEAGLRSGDRTMPEELNRIAVDHISDLLLCPTHHALKEMTREGLGSRAQFAGDVMLDAALRSMARAATTPLGEFLRGTSTEVPEGFEAAPRDALVQGQYGVATLHRAANTDDPMRLERLIRTLGQLPWPVILPLHPRTRNAMEVNQIKATGKLVAIRPAGYLDFAALVAHGQHVLTDSGGVQKEALFHGRPCTTMRDTTEWPETLEGGWNVLVDADPIALVTAAQRDAPELPPPLEAFGGGRAGVAVCAAIQSLLIEPEPRVP